MSGSPIHKTITLLEREIETLDERRRELLRVIVSLRPLANGNSHARARTSKAVNGTNERTNERAKRAPTGPRPRSLPDVTSQQEAIVAALREKSPQSPGALAKRVKLTRPAVTYHLRPLIKAGAVIASGATLNRQFSLPPRSRAAKEAPQ